MLKTQTMLSVSTLEFTASAALFGQHGMALAPDQKQHHLNRCLADHGCPDGGPQGTELPRPRVREVPLALSPYRLPTELAENQKKLLATRRLKENVSYKKSNGKSLLRHRQRVKKPFSTGKIVQSKP